MRSSRSHRARSGETQTRATPAVVDLAVDEPLLLGERLLDRQDTRHFRLDRMRKATLSERDFEPRDWVEDSLAEQEWLVHGEVTTAGVARVWVSPGRARWLREERTVVEELSDGAVVVELPYGSSEWLVREVLKGVGDLVVLEPDEARAAVAEAVA